MFLREMINLKYSLIDKVWICKVYGFSVRQDLETLESSVDLTIKENSGTTVLRFTRASQIEYENRYSHHGSNLEIINLEDSGMETINLKVSGFIESSGNFSFWAENVTEVFH